MLPAPTTIATSTPWSPPAGTWPPPAATRSGAVPYSSSPISASPESFRSMRVKAGAIGGSLSRYRAVTEPREGLLAYCEACEPAYDHILPWGRRELVAQLLDGLALELGIVHLLLEQHDRREPRVELAGDDFLAHVLRLLGRDVLTTDVFDGGRGRDLHGDLAREGDEVLVLGHEVGVAVDLDQHPHLGSGVHICLNRPLRGRALAEILDLLPLLDAQDLDRLLDVALGLGEGLLAVHHPRACALAQGLYVFRSDLDRAHVALVSGVVCSAACAGADGSCAGALATGVSGSATGSALSATVSGGAEVGAAGLPSSALADIGVTDSVIGSDGAGVGGTGTVSGAGFCAAAVAAARSAAALSAVAFSAAAFSSASFFACSSASRLACSSASRLARASASMRAFSSASWRARSSSRRKTEWPSETTCPIACVISAQERIASSLPGTTKSMPSGSQLVSTRPMIGMRRRRASLTAISSVLRSITNMASGTRCMFFTPPRLARSFSRSACAAIRSRVGSRASWPSASKRSRSCSRRIRRLIVWKFVNRPPSQRW